MLMREDIRRFATLVAFAAIVSLHSSSATGSSAANLPNFHRIDANLLRGAQPTEVGLAELSHQGVKTVIDLRGGGERALNERAVVERLGMQYINVPMPNLAAPTRTDLDLVLDKLNNSSTWPVFIHCRRGADRTGLVFACYRIAHDHWPAEQALREADFYGMSRLQRAKKQFIRHYQPTVSVPALADADRLILTPEHSR